MPADPGRPEHQDGSPAERRAGRGALRIAFEILLVGLGIGLLAVVAKSLGPLLPGLAGALRLLLNPFILGLAVVGFLLFRVGRGGKGRG